jgi:hypothetical protein
MIFAFVIDQRNTAKGATMKFICLGFLVEEHWDALSKAEQDALIEECFAYDDQLLKDGRWLDGGQALQSARTAKTLRWKNGQTIVTDGPFAETKDQLGGIGVLEARDMDQAVELMSKHPGVRMGPFEIRPVNEESLERQQQWEESEEGRSLMASAKATKAKTMKFGCLGYLEEGSWDKIAPNEREAMVTEVIAFDQARRKSGHWISGMALRGAATAKTLRSNGGGVSVTDGPYAETKEQLGGIVVNAIADMDRAVEVLSQHPALKFGVVIEIRPIDEEMNARWEVRKARVKKVE